MNPMQMRALSLALLLSVAWAFILERPLASIAASLTEPAPNLHAISLPVLAPAHLMRGFRAPLTDYGAGHRGIDLAASDGAVLLAPASGTVSFARQVNYKPDLTVTTDSGLKFTLEPACSAVPVGTVVSLGEIIGWVCAGAYQPHCSPALCLHFSARNANGYLSPLYLLGQLGPSRLVK
ncbi:MAG: peptidoglycan DD-metalloendopeptidase family protein [Actinomycetales bacterium]|nr:peptidoglycan DD-metalloendopeptidase family protein [Actinomycetales bacterium]